MQNHCFGNLVSSIDAFSRKDPIMGRAQFMLERRKWMRGLEYSKEPKERGDPLPLNYEWNKMYWFLVGLASPEPSPGRDPGSGGNP